MRVHIPVLFVAVLLAGCSSSDSSSPSTAGAVTTSSAAPTAPTETTETTEATETTKPSSTAAPVTTETADTTTDTTPDTTTPASDLEPPDPSRPYDVFVPSTYDAGTAMPLLVLLHGYSASGALQDAYFGLQPLAEQRGFLYVHPDGTTNAIGNQFWNATDACCGFGLAAVDDSAYLIDMVHQIESDYNVDAKRVYFVGHSNGGFMSYRMACDHADEIAAIVSLAGATFLDTSQCTPSEPVSVLEIHGTGDGTIPYDGGQNLGHVFPSAPATVATWATYDGCDATPVPSDDVLDLTTQTDGDDTSVQTFAGCPTGTDVELWTIDGGPHIPPLSPSFAPSIIDFLYAHPKS